VRGEVRLIPYSTEEELPETVERVRVRAPSCFADRLLDLTQVRVTPDAYLVSFATIADRDQAAMLSGAELSILRSDLPPPESGELYLFEVEGAVLIDEEGRELGTVRGIARAGQRSLLVVATARGDRLLPTDGGTIVRFDREARRLTVRLVPGLWEAEEP
jgi:16S rRNA processing protein RimM